MDCAAGTNSAAKIANMAMTASNSTIVKARLKSFAIGLSATFFHTRKSLAISGCIWFFTYSDGFSWGLVDRIFLSAAAG